MDQPAAQHAHDLLYEELVILARLFVRKVYLAQAWSGIALCIGDELHEQHTIEEPVRLRHPNPDGHEPIERIDLGILPSRFLLLASEATAFTHRASLAATAYFSAFLVLRTFLKTALSHVLIDLRAANLR